MADTCSGCGAPVRWVITTGGKRMPLDPDPVPDGNIVPVVVDGRTRARVLTGPELPAQGDAWQSHFRSCPAAPEFRARQARKAPRCAVCQGPMDTDLARLEKWTTHPACDVRVHAQNARRNLPNAPAPQERNN